MNHFRSGAAVALCATAILAVSACSGDDVKDGPTTTLSQLPTGTSSSASAAAQLSFAEQAARAKRGLDRLLAAHPVSAATPQVVLGACPFGTVRSFSSAFDKSANGMTADYKLAYSVVQRYQVTKPNDGVVGDRGRAASCTGRTGDRVLLGVSAATNTTPTPTGALNGLAGPESYRGGQTYAKVSDKDLCSVYWVPPQRNFVLTVLFRTTTPTTSQCRAGFEAAAPTAITALSNTAG